MWLTSLQTPPSPGQLPCKEESSSQETGELIYVLTPPPFPLTILPNVASPIPLYHITVFK